MIASSQPPNPMVVLFTIVAVIILIGVAMGVAMWILQLFDRLSYRWWKWRAERIIRRMEKKYGPLNDDEEDAAQP